MTDFDQLAITCCIAGLRNHAPRGGVDGRTFGRCKIQAFVHGVAARYRIASPSKGRAQIGIIDGHIGRQTGRSEEHTSELQSLMRISYAVFCLKKKKKK